MYRYTNFPFNSRYTCFPYLVLFHQTFLRSTLYQANIVQTVLTVLTEINHTLTKRYISSKTLTNQTQHLQFCVVNILVSRYF